MGFYPHACPRPTRIFSHCRPRRGRCDFPRDALDGISMNPTVVYWLAIGGAVPRLSAPAWIRAWDFDFLWDLVGLVQGAGGLTP